MVRRSTKSSNLGDNQIRGFLYGRVWLVYQKLKSSNQNFPASYWRKIEAGPPFHYTTYGPILNHRGREVFHQTSIFTRSTWVKSPSNITEICSPRWSMSHAHMPTKNPKTLCKREQRKQAIPPKHWPKFHHLYIPVHWGWVLHDLYTWQCVYERLHHENRDIKIREEWAHK